MHNFVVLKGVWIFSLLMHQSVNFLFSGFIRSRTTWKSHWMYLLNPNMFGVVGFPCLAQICYLSLLGFIYHCCGWQSLQINRLQPDLHSGTLVIARLYSRPSLMHLKIEWSETAPPPPLLCKLTCHIISAALCCSIGPVWRQRSPRAPHGGAVILHQQQRSSAGASHFYS